MSKKVHVSHELLTKARNIFLNKKVVFTDEGLLTRAELRALRHKGYLESGIRGGPTRTNLLGWYATDKLMNGVV